ncbi:MAG: alpha-E domain-containing protein [Acidimicrobiia bacterium]
MLLARVAENLYWAGRYLERAEDTARLLREYTNLMVDLPTVVPVRWAPLHLLTGDYHPDADEHAVMTTLIGDNESGSSVVTSVRLARENLRTARDVIPQELWQVVNDLHLYVASNRSEGVARATRQRFLERVVSEAQRAAGVMDGVMSRETAYRVFRLGMVLERADLTLRILDVSAVAFGSPGAAELHASVQWASALRSAAALQMFRRANRGVPAAATVVRFLLLDERFPRSVIGCLDEIERCGTDLLDLDTVKRAALAATDAATVAADGDMTALRPALTAAQTACSEIHASIGSIVFALPAIDAR